MRRVLLVLCGLLIFVWGLPCQAAIYPGTNDTSLHLYNVVVQTSDAVPLVNGIYDVDFIIGSSAFTPDFDNAWIGWAMDAVVQRLNEDITRGIVITSVGSTSSYQFLIPNADLWPYGTYGSKRASYSDAWYKYGSDWYVSGSNLPSYIFADFKPAAVPIPGAVWLLGSGLVGIVGVRRKLKK